MRDFVFSARAALTQKLQVFYKMCNFCRDDLKERHLVTLTRKMSSTSPRAYEAQFVASVLVGKGSVRPHGTSGRN